MPASTPRLIRPRLVHAADTAADRAAYARDVLGYERSSSDYREVLADPEVDVVSICAPNVLHREIGVAAAEAGKHFWIEKPGRTVTETAAVAAAARAAGLVTSIGYNYRHAPAVEHSRELVASGALGRITNLRAVFFSGYAAEPKGALSWRFKRSWPAAAPSATCSATWSTWCSYVVGPVAEVTALTSTVYTERPVLPMGSATHFAVIEDGELGPVEDYAATLVRFAGDAQGAGRSAPWRRGPSSVPSAASGSRSTAPTARRLELRADERAAGAWAAVAPPGLHHRARQRPPGRLRPLPAGPGDRHGLRRPQGHRGQEVPRGRDRRRARRNASVEDALAAAEVVAAAERSAADGSWQQVPAVPGASLGREPAPAPGSSHG